MILVAGGSGFFGLNIARCLADRGENVLLVQRHAIKPPTLLAPYWDKQVKQATGSILDLSFIIGLVKTYKIVSIIHAAAETMGWRDTVPPGSVLDPRGWHIHERFETEVVGTVNCLEATRLMDLSRMVFISSCDNYRGLPEQPKVFHEDAYLPPVAYSPDGNNKRAADLQGFLYAKGYGVSYVSVRLGSNFGYGCDWTVVNKMINSAFEGKSLELPMLPANRRTHIVYAKDSAEGTSALLLAKKPLEHHIYNIAAGVNPTMQEIVDTIKEVIPGAKIKLGPLSDKKADNLVNRPQTMDRIKKEVGFVPMTMKKSIEHYVNFKHTGEY